MDDLSERISSMIRSFDEETNYLFIQTIFHAFNTPLHDPCWCQSGKKYIKCHKKRHELRKISEGEMRKELLNIFDSKKYCSASFDNKNCKMPIKGAHTIQRGRVLSSIAKDGHVGSFYRNNSGFENVRDIKLGVKKEASIFYGFCDFHDTELFKEIELNEFIASPENCWASSYRAICHEYYQKKAAKKAVTWQIDNLDKGYKLSEQLILQEQLMLLKRDVFKGFDDILSIKEKYEQVRISSNYHMISSYVIVINEPLSLAVCGTMSPYYDINGVKIQNLGISNYLFQHFAISTVTVNGKGAYVISYLKEHSVIKNYLSDVFAKSNDFIKSWLTKSIFAYSENCFFNLDWWEELSSDKKLSIYNLAMSENYTKKIDIDDVVSSEVKGEISSIDLI
ncbi:SEC-C domain-containing protein [Pseudocolwellia agarivorans]|uniref:SEC-C domain-containing protein n=1 Tax=Pseudocolwellia agarivorans TaxID=1911682 RepID=UPI0011159122|nr:SEC-C domain-containing protein [Pseudocolwellia agarivorans]